MAERRSSYRTGSGTSAENVRETITTGFDATAELFEVVARLAQVTEALPEEAETQRRELNEASERLLKIGKALLQQQNRAADQLIFGSGSSLP